MYLFKHLQLSYVEFKVGLLNHIQISIYQKLFLQTSNCYIQDYMCNITFQYVSSIINKLTWIGMIIDNRRREINVHTPNNITSQQDNWLIRLEKNLGEKYC